MEIATEDLLVSIYTNILKLIKRKLRKKKLMIKLSCNVTDVQKWLGTGISVSFANLIFVLCAQTLKHTTMNMTKTMYLLKRQSMRTTCMWVGVHDHK